MDAILHRDDVPIEVILNKVLKDAIAEQQKVEYLESLGT